ncbi:hypothetical protein B0H16DRAFT_1457295 [Mycena metata]|uniref:Uncharacterized protein n=1 Tax=Mycena metata TaxID=1033252 RepID=A0AAD7NE52_9AGAR|nr:hypothetical protein B0H16DRAFT_1457295 [Mycena metata]
MPPPMSLACGMQRRGLFATVNIGLSYNKGRSTRARMTPKTLDYCALPQNLCEPADGRFCGGRYSLLRPCTAALTIWALRLHQCNARLGLRTGHSAARSSAQSISARFNFGRNNYCVTWGMDILRFIQSPSTHGVKKPFRTTVKNLIFHKGRQGAVITNSEQGSRQHYGKQDTAKSFLARHLNQVTSSGRNTARAQDEIPGYSNDGLYRVAHTRRQSRGLVPEGTYQPGHNTDLVTTENAPIDEKPLRVKNGLRKKELAEHAVASFAFTFVLGGCAQRKAWPSPRQDTPAFCGRGISEFLSENVHAELKSARMLDDESAAGAERSKKADLTGVTCPLDGGQAKNAATRASPRCSSVLCCAPRHARLAPRVQMFPHTPMYRLHTYIEVTQTWTENMLLLC